MFKRMSELGSTRNNDPLELFGGVGTKPAHVNIVAIFLYEAKGLPAMDRNGLSDFFCKFKLGEEKYKTKVIQETLHPRWNEQFDLFVYDVEERNLEISVWDWDRAARNDFVGDTVLDLSTLENEKLHDLWLEVHKNGLSCGSLHFTVMITGKKISSGEETDADADALQAELSPDIADRYSLLDSWKHVRDVGTLSVKLFKGAKNPNEINVSTVVFGSKLMEVAFQECLRFITVTKLIKKSS